MLASSVEAVERFRKNDSTPLVDVIDSYDIFVTGRHGAQGVLARASKSQIENEFETYDSEFLFSGLIYSKSDEEAIKMILKNGKAEQTKMHQGYSMANDYFERKR